MGSASAPCLETTDEKVAAKTGGFFDEESFRRELSLNPTLDREIRQAVRRRIERRKAEFERVMENHPAAVAERARWKRNREEMERRMARMRLAGKFNLEHAARRLGRRWRAGVEREHRTRKPHPCGRDGKPPFPAACRGTT